MNRIQRRFDELAAMAEKIANSKNTRYEVVPYTPSLADQVRVRPRRAPRERPIYELDHLLFTRWSSSVESLLIHVFGREHPHYENFKKSTGGSPHSAFDQRRAIFNAAKEDFEGGYLFDVRAIVHADLCSDELGQAKELLDTGHITVAAVLAGVVLETTIKELCRQNGIGPNRLSRMNQDLKGAGVYNDTRRDQVLTWSRIRNDAAHGNPDEFNEPQVAMMIDGIREFVTSQLLPAN
jgi:hypothetical protein